MSSNLSILNLDKFKNCVLFSISLRKWSNRAGVKDMAALAAYLDQMKVAGTEAIEGKPNGTTEPAAGASPVFLASDRVRSAKRLINSKNFDALCTSLNDVKAWCLARAMPSYFRKGMFVVKQDQVEVLENALKAEIAKLWAEDGPLENFIRGYAADVANAEKMPVGKGGLGPLFRAADYPSAEAMRKLFDLEWYWLALSVPENIPDSLKAEAGEKFKRRLMDAAEDIETALREEFRELLAKAEERLTTNPGEQPKTFRDSLLGNIKAFLETFDSRNVFADQRLAEMVNKAKDVLLDEEGKDKLTAKKLREYASVRELARESFATLTKEVTSMIEEKATRKMDFTLDED